ncbi:hypothetical protein GE061_015988 [Apolygus lucorum]|uniref:Dynein heavy chain 6, axonemal n=1 Tax=Apolygus lucorum TaxID=248454 RepID=A0A8S9XGX4_APOLU|nr:hypothetical protein GE061_015988 [Apolygus lucorum]
MWPSSSSSPSGQKKRVRNKLPLPQDKVCFLTPHRDALRYFGGIVSDSESEADVLERQRRAAPTSVHDQDESHSRAVVIQHTMEMPSKKKKRTSKRIRSTRASSSRLTGDVHIKAVIAQMRTDKTNSLLYMNYALPVDHKDYSPFSFRIVTFWNINKDKFLTVSNKGVIIGGGSQPIFYTLDVWEKQYDDWAKLTEYRTFKNFQLFKYFVLWHKKVSRKRYVKRKNCLEARLIYTRPELREALMNVQAITCAMAELSFFTAEKLSSATLKQFLKAQHTNCSNTFKTFMEGKGIMKEILLVAAGSDLLSMGFCPDDSNLKVKEEEHFRQSSTSSNAKLGWPLKRPQFKMSYADALNKKNECKKITSTLCVADYQMQQALMNLMHNSINEFVRAMTDQMKFLPEEVSLMDFGDPLDEIIEKPRIFPPKNPMFLIEILLGEEDLEFEPNGTTWELCFRHVVSTWEETVMKIKPLQGEDVFKPYTFPTICGFQEDPLCGYGPKIKDTIKNDLEYVRKVGQLTEILKTNVRYIENYAKRFAEVRQKTIDNINLDRTLITDETALESFKHMVDNYVKDEHLTESISKGQTIGAFFVNLEQFREEVVPLVQTLKELVTYTMAKVGTERVNEASTEVMNALEYLEMEPQTTINFVEYLAYLDTLTPRIEEMNVELEYLDELYSMMEDFKVELVPIDIKRHRDLGFRFSDLQDALEKAQDKRAETVNNFNETISKDFENLMQEVMSIHEKATESWLTDIDSDKLEVMKTLSNYSSQLQELLEKFEQFNNYQRQVKVPVTRLDTLLDVINEVKIRKLIWESMENWNKIEQEWMTCDFEDLDPDAMHQEIAVFAKNITSITKAIGSNALVEQLKAQVDKMLSKLPVITTLRNPNLKQRHWQRIEELIGYKFDPGKIISLTLFDELDVYRYDLELAEISGQASSEASLEALLKKVEDAWKSLEFVVLPYKDIKDVYILAGLEEIQTVLDETNINLSTITSSRNVGPIKTRVMEWIKNIEIFSKTLDEWTKCQTNWMYLEPIFSAPDIQRQLPTEAKLFFTVDKSWKEIMKNVAKNPLAMKAATMPGLYEAFMKNNEFLEQILKCLEAYLESKRVVFPRFYFLSNDELLEILAQTRNPHAVQPHLRKCFDAIARIEFGVRRVIGDDKSEGIPTNDIKAMISPEGEIIQLGKGLKARGNVEEWLGHVEASMFNTLWLLMKACIKDFLGKTRTEWVLNHASQLILTVSQIMWVRGVHAVLTDKVSIADALLQFEQKGFNDLNDLAGMVRGELTHIQREVLKALITVDVHARDIISGLVQSKVRQVSNFEWVKQLRYYWEKKIDNCVACMATARHIYGYEYLGATPRLVITPLTDKCYLCLMGALQLDLGGAPAGPAGTGKTETTKDLAKSLAVMCVVFNCSDGLDYKIMGRFFSGLAQSGAWCCFDEFNRIDIEVLSVIAQQLITIRNAKAAKVKRFMFEGREIKLVPSCAAFITMNPGYAGRTELPDNLKSLFRPMAMMVPDYGLIAEVTLYSEGFETSKVLAQKMVNMYKLCSEQLSHQDHYDFGMRAVKSVLVMAGSLKRQNPDKKEDVVLIRALKDSNLPKFLADDVILFWGILGDLFPGVVLPSHDYGEFQKAIEFVLKEMKLQPVPVSFVKTIQLYETMVVRWGVMTVGPTGGGKTTVLNVLKNTLTRLHAIGVEDPLFRPVTSYTLNPKSVTMGELYGEVNLQSMEWRDGLLGIFVRTSVNCTEERHQWVVCDGPVDAVWIENMNTVLDDNKLLCLSNSERIKLTPWVHMVFEVQDLSQASPATVSRCGMVYIDPDELKWMPFVISWAQSFKVKEHFTDFLYNTLISLFEDHVEKGLLFIKKNCPVGIPQVDISKIAMMCSLIEHIITKKKSPTKFMDVGMAVRMFTQAFIFSYMWSLGGNILDEPREVFEQNCKETFKTTLTETKCVLNTY